MRVCVFFCGVVVVVGRVVDGVDVDVDGVGDVVVFCCCVCCCCG